MPWLTVEQLRCERDDRLLFDQLSFSACGGDVWQVAGPNGAGKTTLLRILAGLHGHYDGRVSWRAGAHLAEQMLYIGHQPGLRDELTPIENLRWLNALHGQRDVDFWASLTRVGLTGFEDVPVGHLSAGQKRRVALARLWWPGKDIWILDEPFTAIDMEGVALVEARLSERAAEGGLVIYTSHHRLNERVRQLHLGEARP